MIGPCMCGGCPRCLHDQGMHCGNVRCCGPLEPEVTRYRVRFDSAYGEQTSEGGFHGHDDRLVLIVTQDDVDAREYFDATPEGAAELVAYVDEGEQDDVEGVGVVDDPRDDRPDPEPDEEVW